MIDDLRLMLSHRFCLFLIFSFGPIQRRLLDVSTSSRRAVLRLVFCILPISLIYNVALAQAPLTIAFTAAQNELTVGDVVTLTLEVTHPMGYRVVPLALGQVWEAFEIRSIETMEVSRRDEDGMGVSRQRVHVTLWAPGLYETPPLLVTIVDNEGNLIEETAESITLTVHSVLIEGDDGLRDIAPQAILPTRFWWPWLLLLMAAVTGGGLWWWRRNRTVAVMPDKRPIHEVTMAKIAQLEKATLLTDGAFKQYYADLTTILKQHVEMTYDVPILERTTVELKHHLQHIPMAVPEKVTFLNLLVEADIVKFSEMTPTMAEVMSLTERARAFVEATKIIAND